MSASSRLMDALVLLARNFGGPTSVAGYADPDVLWGLFSSLSPQHFGASASFSASSLAAAVVKYYHSELNAHAPLVDALECIAERDSDASPGEEPATLRTFLEAWFGAAMQSDSERRDAYLSHILSLTDAHQGSLMTCLDDLMVSLSTWREEPGLSPSSSTRAAATNGGAGKSAVDSATAAEPRAELSAARAEIEDLRAQVEHLQSRLRAGAGVHAGGGDASAASAAADSSSSVYVARVLRDYCTACIVRAEHASRTSLLLHALLAIPSPLPISLCGATSCAAPFGYRRARSPS